MTNPNLDTERDQVLFALHKECSNPTAEQIAGWIKRYPQFADDIRAHAAILKDWAAQEGLPVLQPSEAMISRSHSRAMEALFRAQQAATAETAVASATSFDDIFAMRSVDVPELSRKLNITRGILAALVSGRMLAPVGERLVAAITGVLSISRDTFNACVQHAIANPRLGYAKADGTPGVIARSYEDLVRASSMPEERKRYWLGEE